MKTVLAQDRAAELDRAVKDVCRNVPEGDRRVTVTKMLRRKFPSLSLFDAFVLATFLLKVVA